MFWKGPLEIFHIISGLMKCFLLSEKKMPDLQARHNNQQMYKQRSLFRGFIKLQSVRAP